MRLLTCLAAAFAALAGASSVMAQSSAPPADGSLVINPDAGQWALRAAGVPWICMADRGCVQIRFEGVAAGQITAAEIAPLGFSGGTYYLALRHPDFAAGRQRAFRCVADACASSELPPGDFAFLGTHSLMLQLRLQSRAAILVRPADAPERSRLMWCTDRNCTEQAFTRDNRFDLAFLGIAPMEGRSRVWLRERNGTVFGCGAVEGPGEDRFDCTPTTMVFPDVAAPASEPSETDPQAMIAAVEDAIRRGNWAEADRLIAEGRSRFPQQPQWAQFTQRLTQLRAERDSRSRITQARRLVTDARRFADAGDFRAAESTLDEAARLAPGLPEIAQARADISRLRSERFQRMRERGQLVAAIQRAIDSFRLWEADGLIAEALQRFPNDPQFLNFDRQVDLMRGQAEWQGRVRRAEQMVAEARRAMGREQFGEAERQLNAAEGLVMALPSIRAARAELARLRIEAEERADDIRQNTSDIEALLARGNIVRAERMLDFATRRHPGHPGWADLRRRIDRAKAATPPPPPGPGPTQIARLIAQADAAMARKDWIEANRLIVQAETINRADPAVAAARLSLDGRRLDALRTARRFIADADAAIKAKDWPKADKAVADAEAADPLNPTVQADVRRLKAAIAAGRAAVPGPIAKLLADADAAIAKKDWAEANRLIVRAEAINRTDPAVVAARKNLDDKRTDALRTARRFIADADAAVRAKDWPKAEKAVADAEAADPLNPTVQSDVRRLKAAIAAGRTAVPGPIAKLLADADAAIAKKDWAEANRLIVRAEAINRTDPAVVAARKNLDDKRTDALRTARRFIADADAAVRAKDWPKAEKAVADAEAADPLNPAVQADVRRLKAAIAAGKTAGPAPGPIAPLLAAANAAIAKKDWAAANREIVKAEAINRTDPAVVAARKNLDDKRTDALRTARRFIADADAAVKAKDWPKAEKAVADAEAADPLNPTVQADVRRLKAAIAAGKTAGPAPGPIAPLLAAANAAIARKDWPAANAELVKAEAINRADPAVIAARQRFNDARRAAFAEAQKFIADANAAGRARNWPAAEKAADDALRADPTNPTVQADVRKLKAAIAAGKTAGPAQGPIAPLLAAANAAIARKDWPAANAELVKAEAINRADPAVVSARQRFNDARRDAFTKAQPFATAAQNAINRGNRADADRAVAQVKLLDPFGPALRMLAAEYKKKGW